MAVDLYRIDDRLIHGQVIVGWAQLMKLGFIVLVDDEVAASEWEQELYRTGAPADVGLYFATVEDAASRLDLWRRDARRGMVLTGDIATMRRLIAAGDGIRAVNLGGIHHRAGRAQRLRYLFLAPDEEEMLRGLAAAGIAVTAQDVPSARPVPLDEILAPRGAA